MNTDRLAATCRRVIADKITNTKYAGWIGTGKVGICVIDKESATGSFKVECIVQKKVDKGFLN